MLDVPLTLRLGTYQMPSDQVHIHVLIADDHPVAAGLLGSVLEANTMMAITTDIAMNGAEAVRYALSRWPNVVILDIDMPILDGVSAAAYIGASASPAHMPLFIAMSGLIQRSPPLEDVFDFVLQKPVDLDRVVALLTERV